MAAELAAHTPTLTLAAAWSEVLRQCIATAARLIGDDEALGWTWFVSGSVARGEAIPGSDVETLIVLDDDVDDVVKAKALTLAADVHASVGTLRVEPRREWRAGQPRPILPQAGELDAQYRAVVPVSR